MRLWTLNPKHLDRQGLLGLWREGLLALAVLQDKTKGYKNHPQLNRFKATPNPIDTLAWYLFTVADEMIARGYKPSIDKLPEAKTPTFIPVKRGQVFFEITHLNNKLKTRTGIPLEGGLSLHPLFYMIDDGNIEDWERVKENS